MNDKHCNVCRICLENGAIYPLFENSKSEDCNILSRLTLCLNEKIEDVEGYPRSICQNCNDTIEVICNFVNKYRESSDILSKRIPILKDEIDIDDQGLSAVEKAVNDIKKEIESDDDGPVNDSDNADECLPLIHFKVKDEIKIEHSPAPVKKKRPKKLTIKARSTSKDINKIASSILEGDFAWIGDVWCIKSTKSKDIKEKKVKKYKLQRAKQPKPQILKPKEPKSSEPPTRLCDLCGVIFRDQDKLNIHKRKVHLAQPIKCPHCPRTLVSSYYLKRHVKRRHDTEAKNFTCPTCDARFAFKGEMTTHIRNVHNKHLKPKKTFSCSTCNKTYKCAKSVVVHERSQHTGQRPAVCEICGTSFYHEDYLREHMRLHTGETPFKCPICGRGYAQRCNMKSHLRIHRISDLDANTLSKLRPNYLKLLKV